VGCIRVRRFLPAPWTARRMRLWWDEYWTLVVIVVFVVVVGLGLWWLSGQARTIRIDHGVLVPVP